MADVFSGGGKQSGPTETAIKELHAKIGRLAVEDDFCPKAQKVSPGRKREMIQRVHPKLSISQQCKLVRLNRSAFYYRPVGIDAATLSMMKELDRVFAKYRFFGSRQIAAYLRREGIVVGRHCVRRLMAKMGLEAIYKRPRTSQPHPQHPVYPYLPRKMVIDRPNQVWGADITFVPVKNGFLDLVAIMDWATRKVLSWRLWNRIPEPVREWIKDLALRENELSPRELGVRFTDTEKYPRPLSSDQWRPTVSISEASVYRNLKSCDLIASPAYIVLKAADEFRDKTTRPNQLWQTDFTYLKVIGLSAECFAFACRLSAGAGSISVRSWTITAATSSPADRQVIGTIAERLDALRHDEGRRRDQHARPGA